ncbi:MAG: response regulator transcription factor [Pseudomonadota bacterium]|jgi:FixJ family two-component response regulator
MTEQKSATDAAEAVVYVIDDDQSVRDALEDLLSSVGLHVRLYASTEEFLNHDLADAPGCLVLDVRMPGQSGIDFHQQMASHGIHLPTVFITGHGDISMGVKAIKNGAIEFLTKPFRDQDLLDAIQQGIGQDRARRRHDAQSDDLNKRWETLTTGERDVLRLVVKGLLNKQIAAELNVSEITVKVRRGHVMQKMQAKTLVDLVRIFDLLGV